MPTLTAERPGAPVPYEPIALDLQEHDIQGAFDAYLEFIELPEAERVRLAHFDPNRPRTGRSGYVQKKETDQKHVFHMHPALWEEFSLDFSLPAASRQLLRVAHGVYDVATAAARIKYQELEEEVPRISPIHFPRSGVVKNHMRFIAYTDDTSFELARPHYDKGTGTIAIAETSGGLRIGFGPDDLTEVRRQRIEPVFFHGFGWHQLAEILDVPVSRRAGWHDVINVGERVNEKIARLALVYFIDPTAMYLESTKEQTHTPIPWRGLGSLALRSDNQLFCP